MNSTLQQHWPEYLIEAWALGTFMLAAAASTALLEHPASPVRALLPSPLTRRALIGLAMGLTAIALIYSPWGQRSGAHLNPATTLTFLHLGKIQPWDATFYVAAQFLGGLVGIWGAKLLLGDILADDSVRYVTTVPGPDGAGVAFLAEAALAGGMMLMVLCVTNTPRLASYTGLFAGTLVCLYITFEAPLSGMSINPARTTASALPSGIWTGGWVYFTAPVLGMLLAAQTYLSFINPSPRACPKLQHGRQQRCIFCAAHASVAADVSPRNRAPAATVARAPGGAD